MVRNYIKVGVHKHKGRLPDKTRNLAVRLIKQGRPTIEVINESGISRSLVQRLRKKLQAEVESGGGMPGLIRRAEAFSKEYMAQYDASHDWQHILRVLRLAKRIEAAERLARPDVAIDGDAVTLACMMHDVGDKKYLRPGQDGTTMVQKTLETLGAEAELAHKVQMVVSHISYSNELKNPQQVHDVLQRYPELGIVQDADRLDAMGAVGIGRTFTYNAARPTLLQQQEDEMEQQLAANVSANTMDDPFNHIEEKLVKLGPLMKTSEGRRMADEREARLRMFQEWWADEVTSLVADDEFF